MRDDKKAVGRPGISLDDVRLACEQLDKEGRLVGPYNVRLVLNRGSFSTILKHMRTLNLANAEERRDDFRKRSE